MRALLCKQFGPPESLVVEDIPSPVAGEGKVVVSVRAAAVNFPDTLIIQDKYQHKPPLPFSPGGDLAGVVKEVGPGVTGFKPGDRVMAFLTWGAFREEVEVAAPALAHLPDKVPFDLGASFGMTHSTSYYSLKQCGKLGPGQTLLVLGASGGVGMAAVELGKLMGARVIACASTTEKLEACRRAGADELINYGTENLRERLKALVGEKGVDVCYDPVGGKYADPAIRSMAWEGRYLVVGFASGEIPKVALNLALIKGCQIIGIRRGQFMIRRPRDSAQNVRELLDWIAEGKLKPVISARYPLEQAGEAISDLANRRIIGKAVIDIS